jgi:hypothetical protein
VALSVVVGITLDRPFLAAAPAYLFPVVVALESQLGADTARKSLAVAAAVWTLLPAAFMGPDGDPGPYIGRWLGPGSLLAQLAMVGWFIFVMWIIEFRGVRQKFQRS